MIRQSIDPPKTFNTFFLPTKINNKLHKVVIIDNINTILIFNQTPDSYEKILHLVIVFLKINQLYQY